MSQALDDLERLLYESSPTPREEFVRELERALPSQRSEYDRRRVRIVVAGCGLATALAGVAIGLDAVGLLPFTSGRNRAQADRDCKTVLVEHHRPRPYFVRTRSGDVEVRFPEKPERRLVRRCR